MIGALFDGTGSGMPVPIWDDFMPAVLDPKPYMDPTKTRYNTALYTSPTDVRSPS